jgi:hypothetical protein
MTPVVMECPWCIRIISGTFVAHCSPPLAPRLGRDETPVFVFLIKDRVP